MHLYKLDGPASKCGIAAMHKVTFTERRSGEDRRKNSRRSFWRWFRTCLKPATYRRRRIRRMPYIRGETYSQYEPDRL